MKPGTRIILTKGWQAGEHGEVIGPGRVRGTILVRLDNGLEEQAVWPDWFVVEEDPVNDKDKKETRAP